MSTSWSGTSGDENSEQFQDFSQELRFAGSYANLDYLVGGFYANEYLRQNQQLLFGTAYNPLINEALISAIRARRRRCPTALQLFFGTPTAQFPRRARVTSTSIASGPTAIRFFTNETYPRHAPSSRSTSVRATPSTTRWTTA